jgi:formiminoglutamase
MKNLIILTKADKKRIVNKRPRESKFGDHVQLITDSCNIYEQLKNLDVRYVLFGIPEDIGVFANYGNLGASGAWKATLKFLLNMQHNDYSMPQNLAILGHLDYSAELERLKLLSQKKSGDIKKAQNMVADIDKDVAQLVTEIVKAGKKPIIVGGGHNNAYGNIKGTSLALNTSINVINIDTHTDFRAEEGRHSGNAFSYAYSEGFLRNYFIFGIHENYTANYVFKRIDKIKSIAYTIFEDLAIRKSLKYKSELKRALNHVSGKAFGIEIDCDAIENIPSSAKTPSGFSANRTRSFVHYFGSHKNASYLHICEGAPVKKMEAQVGKLIAYLITDFMKA